MSKQDIFLQTILTRLLTSNEKIEKALNIKSDPLSIYPEYMTKAHICAAYHCSGSTVERMAQSGEVRKIQAAKGKTTTYEKEAVRAYFKRHELGEETPETTAKDTHQTTG